MPFGVPRNPFGGDLVPPLNLPPDIRLPPMAAAVQQKPRFFDKDGGWRDIVGIIADALAGASGGTPMYAPMKMRMRERLMQQDEEERKRNLPIRTEINGDYVEIDPTAGSSRVLYHGQPKAETPTAFQRDYEFVKGIDPTTAEQMVRNRGLKTATIYNPETGNYELRLIGGADAAPPPRLKAPPPDAIPLGGAGSGPRGFR